MFSSQSSSEKTVWQADAASSPDQRTTQTLESQCSFPQIHLGSLWSHGVCMPTICFLKKCHFRCHFLSQNGQWASDFMLIWTLNSFPQRQFLKDPTLLFTQECVGFHLNQEIILSVIFPHHHEDKGAAIQHTLDGRGALKCYLERTEQTRPSPGLFVTYGSPKPCTIVAICFIDKWIVSCIKRCYAK